MERDRVYLLDILEAARLAVSYVQGVSEEMFLKDTQLQDSVIRRIEIIGEAARRVSETTRDMLANVPWPEMIGMRNMMIHDYDDVDFVIVWETVQHDLPALIRTLEPVLAPKED
jgi:uncharacterized protein with HEPN domain